MDRLILALRSGRWSGRQAVLSPGGRVTVGRAERCDLAVVDDPLLSSVHFSVSWSGVMAEVLDRGSRFGTELAGERIEGAKACGDGAWIHAGRSEFTLHREGASPIAGGRHGLPSLDAPRARVLGALRRVRAPLFAILDAARAPRVRTLLLDAVDRKESLYEGERARPLDDVAPWLVQIAPDSLFLERLLAEGWGERFAIFLTSRAPFTELRRHLRRFLMVEDETRGVRVYFRFYDPAILRVFLQSANRRQREALFAAVERFLAEDEDGGLSTFAAEDGAS